MKRLSWNSRIRQSYSRRGTRRPGPARANLERLEPRVVLAGDLVIAEVMSDNEDTIKDEDGEPSDWFEIYNAGNQPVDLAGWHVTDELADRTKWTFPSVTVNPGESIVVFASNEDRRDPEGELHTNFRLAPGDYLGLYMPDGRTLAYGFDALPDDYEDVSYGVAQELVPRELVGTDGESRLWLPKSAGEEVATATWTAADYDASSWTSATGGIGFDNDPTDGDFGPLIGSDIAATMQGQTATAYVRHEFQLADELPTYKGLDLSVNYDDGFIAYLNGREVARVNAPDATGWDSKASAEHGGIQADVRYENFADADDRDDFTLRGDASWNGDRLTLTAPVAGQTSAVWTSNPIAFGADYTFSASTVYDIHTPGGPFVDGDGIGAEGITFVLQNNDNNVLGIGGGGLGLDNTGSTFLAIELDSNAAGSFDPDNTLNSHLGITTHDGSVARVGIPRFNGDAFFPGQPGPGENLIYLWVDYVGETQTLDVYMADSDSKPATPTLSTTINLAELFGEDPGVYVGWTSATSEAFNGHDVLGMSIRTGVGELGRDAELFNLNDHLDALQPGKNVLAIQAFNIDAADEDMLISASLSVDEVTQMDLGYFLSPTPGDLNGPNSAAPSAEVSYSVPSKIYTEPFDLELIPPSEGATIYYTLDGSIPDETSLVYTDPLRIENSVRVRARAVEPGKGLSRVTTSGYTQLSTQLTSFENGQVFESNLPIVVVDGFGQDPGRQTRRLAPMVGYFIDPGDDGRATLLDTPEYVGRLGMRGRGQSSEGWPKKQYAVEFWEEGNDDSRPLLASDAADKNVSIFGLPADSDWVLNGPYSDKTQLNNYLTFNWYREMGLYAPRVRLVEVFVNQDRDGDPLDFDSDYRGTYVLIEKIKIDQNRVDIAQLSPGDNDPDEITGGYIWKKDKPGAGDIPWNTPHNPDLRMVEPQDPIDRRFETINPGEISLEQKEWLQNHILEFEEALYGENFADPHVGYQKYIDVDSWVDTWLMVQMTKNIDGFRLSTYYTKDRGGKIKQGPAWDYNLSLGNGDYLRGGFPDGWYDSSTGISVAQYPYWDRLFEDPNFAVKVSDRWAELRRTIFTTENLMADIDAAVNQLTDGNPLMTNLNPGDPSNPVSRNFDRWSTGSYSESVYFWPNCFFGGGTCAPSPLPPSMSTTGRPNSYDDYIFNMKWWLENRVAWMDGALLPPLDVSPPSGLVDQGTQVTITGPEGYDVYYTLDGSDPRQPLTVKEEATLIDSNANASLFVPSDSTLIGFCDDGLRLTEPDKCFVNPDYELGVNGETWTDVTLPIGYDLESDYDAIIQTDVEGLMHNVNASAYLRIPFEISEELLDDATDLTLSTTYDDGFVLYSFYSTLQTPIEITRVNGGNSSRLPIRALSYDATATATHPDEQAMVYQDFDISNALTYLRSDATNYLIFQLLNENASSTDFLFDVKLTVGAEHIEVSPSVLRYDGPITIDRNSVVTARGFDPSEEDWTAVSILNYIVDAAELLITEINYNPADPTEAELASNPNLDNDDFEFVEIKNVGSQATSLLGISFDGFDLTLGDVALEPGEHGVVVRNLEAFTLRYGDQVKVLGEFFGGALDNGGETIRILDPFETPLVEVAYDDNAIWPNAADGNGASLQLVSPDTTPADIYSKYYAWESSVEFGGSPGAVGMTRPTIRINEVLAATDPPTANDPDLGVTDSIELYNYGASAVDISGWWLSDSSGTLTKFQIPANTVLAPGGYVVFNESHFNGDEENDFALSGFDGEEVWLSIADAQGQIQSIVDNVSFPASLYGESFGRDARGWLAPQLERTLGSENSDPRVGPVVITEINYNPVEPTEGDLAIYPELTSGDLEFVELYNPTAAAVDLTDWRVRGGIDFNFSPNQTIAAGEVLVLIRFNPTSPDNASRVAAFRNHYGLDETTTLIGGYGGGLSSDGERVTLYSTDTAYLNQPVVLPLVVQDEVIFDDRVPWPVEADGSGSLQRLTLTSYGNDGTSWKADSPTPGQVSFDGVLGDFDGDGRTDESDIQLLFEQLQSGQPDPSFDLNGDGMVSESDRDVLIVNILGTTYGDANLDGYFDSGDLVSLFQNGEYEDGIPNNSTWSEGDWNGDGDFDASDLLFASQFGGYVQSRPQPAVAVAALPATRGVAALEADRVLADFADQRQKATYGPLMLESLELTHHESIDLLEMSVDDEDDRKRSLLNESLTGNLELDDDLLDSLIDDDLLKASS